MAIVKKSASTAIVNWESELAKHAEAAAAVEQMPAGHFVSFKSGQLVVNGQPIKGNEADVVIVGFVYENKMYEGKYNADAPNGPVCYAFSSTEEGLKPHEKCVKPQHEQCADCPKNEWDTAVTGKGKACKNVRRLALISVDNVSDPDQLKDADIYFAEIPVTSVKGWSGYVKTLAATLKRPPFGVVTKLAVVPDAKTQFKVTFSNPRPVPAEWGAVIMAKVAEAKESIAFPYPEPREEEAAPATPAKKRTF